MVENITVQTCMGYVKTITFRNNSTQEVVTWVCKDAASYFRSLERLKGMPHIEVLQSGLSKIA